MTAAAVCERMLRNLCQLYCTDSNPYFRTPDRRQLPSRLFPCLLRLAPKNAVTDALAALAWQITVEADNGGPAELYLKQYQKQLVRVVGKARSLRNMQQRNTLWVAGGRGQLPCEQYSRSPSCCSFFSALGCNAVGLVLLG